MTTPQGTKVPLAPIAIVMFTLASVGTFLVVPHVVIASINDWPPQLMTVHSVATVGFWLAGMHLKEHPRTAAADTDDTPAWGSGPHHRKRDNELDDLAVGFAALDQKELDELERRLRETDG